MLEKLLLKELSFTEYYLLPEENRCSLSDYYVGAARQGRGCIAALCSDKLLLSYAVVNEDGEAAVISYIYTLPEYRLSGYAEELIRRLSAREDRVYCLHFTSAQPAAEALNAIAKKTGFSYRRSSTIFKCKTDEKLWARLDAMPVEKMKALLLGAKRSCISFEKLTEAELQLIADSPKSDFKNTLKPAPFLNNPARSLSKRFSFAMLEEGELIAYTLVTRPRGKSAVIEHIASSAKAQGSGAAVVPLLETLAAVREIEEIENISMTIDDNNEASKGFTLSMLSGVELSETKNISCYYKRIQ